MMALAARAYWLYTIWVIKEALRMRRGQKSPMNAWNQYSDGVWILGEGGAIAELENKNLEGASKRDG